MQFIIQAYDGKDAGAPERRKINRPDHLNAVKGQGKLGQILVASGILDEEDRVIGSLIVANFNSLKDLREKWLDSEPYVVSKVWEDIRIIPCTVPEMFISRNFDD